MNIDLDKSATLKKELCKKFRTGNVINIIYFCIPSRSILLQL